MARRDREYDWLDDPFDERASKKAAASMGGGSKAFVGVGCVVAIVLIVVLFIVAASGLAGVAATM